MTIVEYNGTLEALGLSRPILVSIPANIRRKIIGSKRYKKSRKGHHES